ncbi:DNA-binding response regulator [Phyllobacterium brassicacearum]|uniref:DNA-binding response regulator n=1 Tax=Phyllobacterium brassicacearum TaxID=314235 RepID=A0A2P7BPU5_9HYPH|nr:response regulator transcription factor [Phyllobacterium brassicacearum]PSH68470.1 DNA-binding response regulator [Phyllobacterium brassicacearum]TDQ31727.1 LuxR family two component transcriptional regulator [Phyllobacterium brassicacearum]
MNISTGTVVTAKETLFEQNPIVLVVDDDESLRLSICELLESVGIQAAGFATTQALMDAEVLDRPGCMILDVRMPGVSGLEFQSRLAASGISASIIFLTGYGDIPMTVHAMKAGAIEFLTKPVRDQTLLDAVSKAIEIDKEKRAEQLTTDANVALYATLTPRERQVMEAVVRGALSKQIAFELNISEITVKLHRSSVMKKMKPPFLTHLVRAWQSIPADIRDGYPV